MKNLKEYDEKEYYKQLFGVVSAVLTVFAITTVGGVLFILSCALG